MLDVAKKEPTRIEYRYLSSSSQDRKGSLITWRVTRIIQFADKSITMIFGIAETLTFHSRHLRMKNDPR